MKKNQANNNLRVFELERGDVFRGFPVRGPKPPLGEKLHLARAIPPVSQTDPHDAEPGRCEHGDLA